MSENYIDVRFVYRDGGHEELKQQHQSAFHDHEEIGIDGVFVGSAVGDLKISTSDVPEITGMSELDNYTDESEREDWDLRYAPLVKYWLDDISPLTAHDVGSAERRDALEILVEIVNYPTLPLA